MENITSVLPNMPTLNRRQKSWQKNTIVPSHMNGKTWLIWQSNPIIPGIGITNSWDEYLYIYFNTLVLHMTKARRGVDELQIPSGNSPRHDFHILPVFHIFPTKFCHIWQYIPFPIIYQFMIYSSIFHILPVYDIYFHTKYFQIFCAIWRMKFPFYVLTSGSWYAIL